MCMVIYNVKTVGGALLDKMIGMSINYSTWSNGSSTINCYGNGLLLNGRRANIYATAVTQFINTNMHLSGSGTHLRLKSHEMSFDHNLSLGCSTVLNFGQYVGMIPPCPLQNLKTVRPLTMAVIDEKLLAGFEIKLCFGWISYIATSPGSKSNDDVFSTSKINWYRYHSKHTVIFLMS